MSEHDDMAATLEATGRYRVLRRLVPRSIINEPAGVEDLRLGSVA